MNSSTLRRFGLMISLIGIIVTVPFWLPALQQEKLWNIPDPQLNMSALRIIPNQGQWDEQAAYRIRLRGGNVWLEQQAFTYHFFDFPEDHGVPHAHHGEGSQRELGHVFKAHFVGSQADASIDPGLIYPEYHNYFLGNDPQKWASKVPLYGLVTYRDLYADVDLRVYGIGDNMKYEFVVAAGADPDLIRVAYEGIQPELTEEGELVFTTSIRTLREQPPLVYQEINGKKELVEARFRLEKNVVSYEFPDGYDASHPLIIDPTLVFSTYTGSFSDNWGFTATYDTAGHAYGGGIQFGPTSGSGYPTTVGAYDQGFNGGQTDVTVAKFSPNGNQMLYSSFIGGSNADQPHSMIVNSQNQLIIMGRTNSTNFPAINGFDTNPGGNFDIFVARMSEDGTALLNSTFLGGSGDDGVNGSPTSSTYTATKYNYGDDSRGEVIVDEQDFVYVAAPTQSTDFPVSPGAFQTNYANNQDGVVIKLSPDLTTRSWATYFGGSNADAIHTLKLDANHNVYIAGGSNSALPTTGGAIFGNLQGNTDGFIARLSANGSALQRCTYLGTSAYDQVYLMDIDEDGDVYVVGQTLGNFPVISPASGQVYEDNNAPQFVTKMNPNLTNIIFSTTFGTANANFPNISPTAFLVDVCDNLYITGWGGATNSVTGSPNQGNTNNMPLTNDAYDSSTDGSDFYLIVLDRDAQNLVYGSYFGSQQVADHVDGGTSRFDKTGVVYHAVCAGCGGSSTFPTTPGVVSTTNNSTNCNLAVFKLAFDLAGVEAEFTPLDANGQPIVSIEGCAPLFVDFENDSYEGATPTNVSYFWDFGVNGDNSTDYEPTYLYEQAGVYEVMLIITDSASCNISDTTFRTITVVPPPDVDAGPDQTTCPGDTITLLSQTSASAYQWSPSAFVIGDPNQAQVEVFVPSTIDFILTITDSVGCTASDTVRISTENALTVIADEDLEICRGGSAQLGVSVSGNRGPITSYLWTSVPAGAQISDPTIPDPLVVDLDTTTLFIIQVEDSLGCTGTDTIEIAVYEVFTLEDTFLCRGDSLEILTSNGVSFTWSPDDGTISATDIASPTVWPTQTSTYTVEATSIDGCISIKDVVVEVLDLPTAEAGDDAEYCIGGSTQLSGTGGIGFQWTPDLTLSDDTIFNPVANPDSTTRFFLTVTDSAGCQDTDSVLVTVHPLPNIDAGEDQTICEQDTAQLNASGGITYEWSPVIGLSNPSIANPSAFPTDTISYIVNALDENSCQNSDTVTIFVAPKPITDVSGINLCTEEYIELTATGGESYIWNTGDTSSVIQVNPTTSTTYTVTAVVGQCVGFPDTITVDAAFGYPTAAFQLDLTNTFAPQSVPTLNLSSGAIGYQWDPDFGNPTDQFEPVFGYPGAGTYTVELIALSEGGCADTATQTFTLENVVLLVPSAFTPNLDDINDYFLVGHYGIQQFDIKIYSRWGMIVYESDDPDFEWNGDYKGQPAPEGVYVYVVRATGENLQQYLERGTVTLVR